MSPLGILLFLTVASTSLGLPITGPGGKLSISNFAPVIFGLLGILAYRRALAKTFRSTLLPFLLFNLTCLLSFLFYLLRYQWEPNFVVLGFLDVELIFCVALAYYANERPDEFRSALLLGLVASAAVSTYYLFQREPIPAFGMDDHSQGAVLLCLEAYILIRFFGGLIWRGVGLYLFALSFLTISRLPVFFVPAILYALGGHSRLRIPLLLIAASGLSYVLIADKDTIEAIFTVYDRLSSLQTITGEASTSAHLLLLKTALELKFHDIWSFVLGIGPSNFSKALTSFPVPIDELKSLDPVLVAVAAEGNAPLHSTPMQMLLDYNIVIFLGLTILGLRSVHYLWTKHRNGPDIALFAGLFAASMFYSVHDKPYFYLFGTAIGVLIIGERSPEPVETTSIPDTQSSNLLSSCARQLPRTRRQVPQ